MPGVAEAPASYRVTTAFRGNAKTWANMFEARMLEPGIVSYEDQGFGKSFLTRDAIERSMNSFVGKPLILSDDTRRKPHEKIRPEDLERKAKGYISSWFWGPDGWAWARGVVFDDKAKDAIRRIGLCSCGYNVEAAGPGGSYHAIPYDERIDSFSGEHLAIAELPRYEGATIRLNSKATAKTKTHMSLFKWFKKPAAEAAPAGAAPAAVTTAPAVDATKNNAVAAAEDISAETEFEIPTADGKSTAKVKLATLIEAHNARENGIDPEAEIEVDGKPVKLADLVAGYKTNAAKPAVAAETPEAKAIREKAEKDAETARANATAPAKPSHFRVLSTARDNASALPTTPGSADTQEDRIARGNARYGSKPATAGKN